MDTPVTTEEVDFHDPRETGRYDPVEAAELAALGIDLPVSDGHASVRGSAHGSAGTFRTSSGVPPYAVPGKGKGADPARGHASGVPPSYADVLAEDDWPSPTGKGSAPTAPTGLRGKGSAHTAPTGLRGKGSFTAAAYDTWAPGTYPGGQWPPRHPCQPVDPDPVWYSRPAFRRPAGRPRSRSRGRPGHAGGQEDGSFRPPKLFRDWVRANVGGNRWLD